MTFSRSFQAEIMRVLAIAGLIMIATAVFGQGGQQPSATPPEFTPAQREAREELNLTAAEYKRGHRVRQRRGFQGGRSSLLSDS